MTNMTNSLTCHFKALAQQADSQLLLTFSDHYWQSTDNKRERYMTAAVWTSESEIAPI